MIDGGVRSGADVVKALALGAKAVGLGRPFLYANGTHGQEGVVRVCQSMSLTLCLLASLYPLSIHLIFSCLSSSSLPYNPHPVLTSSSPALPWATWPSFYFPHGPNSHNPISPHGPISSWATLANSQSHGRGNHKFDAELRSDQD